MGVLFPWLLSLGCTQVWQVHVAAELEGTCRVAVVWNFGEWAGKDS